MDSTQKKNRKKKKIKSHKKNGLFKKKCFSQIKRQIVLLFYPFLIEPRKEGW